jgi:type IV secretion system protein TrbL
MRRPSRPPIAGLLVAIALAALAAPAAQAAVVAAGVQAGTPTQAAVQADAAAAHGGGAPCNVGIPIIGGAVSALTNAACAVGSTVASGVGSIVSGVGNSILDAVATWLIGAATAITSFVAAQMTATTTPALRSSWFEAQFAPIAALGAALALLVTLVALGSAALRRSPDALAGTIVAVVRAGFGTGVIVALTAIGLGIADAISADIITSSPHAFWSTVAAAWGHHAFGGFGSSALAALIALVEVFGALLVWLELIVRNAVIYIAVLFFPVALAASIWPPLGGWTGRLGRLLLLFVMLKPVTLIVLSLAGNAAASGLSFSAGASASVGTILAAVVIFALAAFAPWALMYLLSADAESAWTGGALRAGAGGAVAGTQGRSVRDGGGLANLRSGTAGGDAGASGGHAGGGPNGGGRGGGGSGGGTPPSGGSSSAQAGAGSGGAGAGSNGGSATAAGVIGGGSVAAAAGMQGAARRAGGAIAAADGGSATPGHVGHQPGASSGGSPGGGAQRNAGGKGHLEPGGAQHEGGGAKVVQFGARSERARTDTGSRSADRSGGRSTGAPGPSTPAGSRPRRPGRPPAGPGEGRA